MARNSKEKNNKYERLYKKTNVGRYNQYKSSANRRGFELNLSKEQFNSLLSKACIYCGSNESIGIDRIDNSLGYTLENSSPCCTMCNMMKKNFPVELFLEQCHKISTFNN